MMKMHAGLFYFLLFTTLDTLDVIDTHTLLSRKDIYGSCTRRKGA